jgi:hypothetical protein
MAYNNADLQLALTTWQLTDAQQAAGAAAKCHGDADAARAAGCPADVLAANAPRQQAARDEYVLRRNTLAAYLCTRSSATGSCRRRSCSRAAS